MPTDSRFSITSFGGYVLHLMKSFQNCITFCRPVLACVVGLQVGCAVEYLSPDNPYADIPDRSSVIAIGQMNRGDVRAALGTPIFSSQYWRFELFRATTEQSEVPVALTPWPIPFARVTDQIHRYTLIAYDPGGQVTEVDTGVFREAPGWRSGIRRDHPSLFLRSTDTMFFVDELLARSANLLVAATGRDEFLRHLRKSNNCTVVVGCGKGGCANELSVDGEKALRLPLRIAVSRWDGYRTWVRDATTPSTDEQHPWLEALVALDLTPGRRVLNFSATSHEGHHSTIFSCSAREVSYLMINASVNKGTARNAFEEWVVDRTDTMPDQFAWRPLVLVYDGTWYVSAEPDRH